MGTLSRRYVARSPRSRSKARVRLTLSGSPAQNETNRSRLSGSLTWWYRYRLAAKRELRPTSARLTQCVSAAFSGLSGSRLAAISATADPRLPGTTADSTAARNTRARSYSGVSLLITTRLHTKRSSRAMRSRYASRWDLPVPKSPATAAPVSGGRRRRLRRARRADDENAPPRAAAVDSAGARHPDWAPRP